MKPLRIAIVGFGKIAADQHVPSIRANRRFELVATTSRQGAGVDGVTSFTSHDALLAADLGLDAVAICTPPSARYSIARACLDAKLHTMLEKPPGVTLGEVEALARLADERAATLMATWHAQANPAVAAAADLLAGQRIARMRIDWREDVRKWHPGQQWIWEPGGFGVFDPGINALSIVARIFPGTLIVRAAELVYPANRQTPIAASLAFAGPDADGDLTAEFDWRYEEGEAWIIEIATAAGSNIVLRDGGTRLEVDGAARDTPGAGEYAALYADFVDLIDCRTSSVDIRPLRLVADAFLLGTRSVTEPFD